MNEGWATFWHSKIMTEKALDASEIVDYADHASMVTATSGGRLNPYKMGVELFRHIKDRWDKGQFGRDWDECESMDTRESWDKKVGLGMQKIFEVRKTHNDITFIDEFLTYEFAREQKLFSFGYNRQNRRYEIESKEFKEVKHKLLLQLTNMGQPKIRLIDANAGNRGYLLLEHEHTGVDLDPSYTQEVLRNLHAVWSRPVAIRTREAEKDRALLASFDGTEFKEEDIANPDADPSCDCGNSNCHCK
jgi:stage V sporulation protein R